MKHIIQRLETLTDLRKKLIEGPPDRNIKVGSYLQILDLHINLLDEVNTLADSIRDGNEEVLGSWIENRITNDELYATQPEDSQQLTHGTKQA